MRHLKTLGVGPSDLIPPISTNMTALTDCPIRCRAFSPRSLELFAEAHQAEASRRTDVKLLYGSWLRI